MALIIIPGSDKSCLVIITECLMRTGCRGDVHKGQRSEGAGRDDSLRVLQVNMTRSGCICVLCVGMHACM